MIWWPGGGSCVRSDSRRCTGWGVAGRSRQHNVQEPQLDVGEPARRPSRPSRVGRVTVLMVSPLQPVAVWKARCSAATGLSTRNRSSMRAGSTRDRDRGLTSNWTTPARRAAGRFRAHGSRQRRRFGVGTGRGQTQFAMAHLGPRHAPGARRARGAARFAPLAHAVVISTPVGGAGAQGLKQLRPLARQRVMLGAHAPRPGPEQLEEIGLPIHDADHPRLAAHRRRRLLAANRRSNAASCWSCLAPTPRGVPRPPAVARHPRRIETATQHPQRQPLAIDRQGQADAGRASSKPAPDEAQALAGARKVQVRRIHSTVCWPRIRCTVRRGAAPECARA